MGAHEPSAAGCSTAGGTAAHRKQVSTSVAATQHCTCNVMRIQDTSGDGAKQRMVLLLLLNQSCFGVGRSLAHAPPGSWSADPGVLLLPCYSYMEPTYASIQLIDQGRKFLMLDKLKSLTVSCPVRIIHGVQVCTESIP